MSALRLIMRLMRDTGGASAEEFALVVPVFLLFVFATIDAGNYGWTLNRDEKATQMGVRMAAVTAPVVGNLTLDFVGQSVGGTTLAQGDPIPASALGVISCTSTACDCSQAGTLFANSCTLNTTSFNAIVRRMQKVAGNNVTAANVVVEYRGSGLGYAGDSSCNGGTGCMQISPLVSVRLRNMTYPSLTLQVFGASVPIPQFTATLPMEDGSGSLSN
ncbi:TadE/TadG family type IV pilus assembly protein [Novosphingobium rosa]|uniref:TadE/TadG family type IV pilus assembly protein n=1 Tax=Novosphingobium rosa TaxID=76978 RepID=UPI00082CBBBC|nr:TadE family protein [Novosphingobium rosa]